MRAWYDGVLLTVLVLANSRTQIWSLYMPNNVQYFSIPHLFQLDSSGIQWNPLESTGISLCVDFFIFIYYILGTFQVIPVDSSTV